MIKIINSKIKKKIVIITLNLDRKRLYYYISFLSGFMLYYINHFFQYY
jgi:hypothetical protein